MEELQLIREKIAENKDEMIETLQELVKINSEKSTPELNKPFGKGVDDAFLYLLNKAESDGFTTENVDNYGGHIDMACENSKEKETMGMLVHLDVVPAGDGWDYDPYGGEIIDGKMYGRGTSDDKGPTIATYYAMKAIKDAGIKLNKNVRIIVGLDEETGWSGMYYYLSKIENPADFGFAPDGDFPVVNGEMGILNFELAKKFGKNIGEGIELRSFKGGHAPNMVADYARAVINSKDVSIYEKLKEKAAIYRKDGFKVNAKGVGKSFEIVCEGVSAHGATPEKGVNAISIMMKFLGGIEFNNEDVNDMIKFYNDKIGFQLDGENLDVDFEDTFSGKTIVNVGTIEMDSKAAHIVINVRYPVTWTAEDFYRDMAVAVEPYNIGIVKLMTKEPIFMVENDPLVETLVDVYRNNTGDYESKPIVTGGGTYARALPNFLSYGALFPGEEELFHQKNEFISLDNFVKATEIYAEAIYRLCK